MCVCALEEGRKRPSSHLEEVWLSSTRCDDDDDFIFFLTFFFSFFLKGVDEMRMGMSKSMMSAGGEKPIRCKGRLLTASAGADERMNERTNGWMDGWMVVVSSGLNGARVYMCALI